jgi:hypothetical protein
MWATWLVAGVALAGVAFMLRFLAALLHENARSVCYRVVPVRQEMTKEQPLGVLPSVYFDDDGRPTEINRADYRRELLENEHYGKEKPTAGFVVLGVHPVFVGWGRSSIHPKRGDAFREPWL